MHPLLRGALAGTLATVPMTIVMTGLFRRLPREQRYPLPPVLITARVARRGALHPLLPPGRLSAAALTAHFAYGAATGALYPMLDRRREPTLAAGSAYGLAVWAISYLGWIPALRILTPATRHPAARNRMMWSAHVVWGSALAAVCRMLARREGAQRIAARPSPVRHPIGSNA